MSDARVGRLLRLAEPPGANRQLPFLQAATPEFFDILRIRIVEGRTLTAADDSPAADALAGQTHGARPWRLGTALLALFSSLALFVGAIGLYAAFSHAVTIRRQESLPAAIGGRWLQSLLFDTAPGDPVVLGSAGAVMLIVAMAATLVPARVAARANPAS